MLAPRKVDRQALWAFTACVIAEVLFVLAFDPFPTVDMGAHLASARGFADLVAGGSVTGARLVEWSLLPAPNLLPQLVLAGLVPAVGAHRAERLILIGYVILLSIATVWAIRQIRPGAMPLAFFVLPLTFNLAFLYGFLNFSYSIAAFLAVAGLLSSWNGQLSGRRALVLALVLVVVFFTHLVGYVEAVLLTACILAPACMLSDRPLSGFVRAAIAVAPGALLALTFLSMTSSHGAAWFSDLMGKSKGLVSLTWAVAAYDRMERLPCVAAALALWTLVLIAAVRSRGSWIARPLPVGLAGFVILSSVLAILGPENSESGGTLASPRLALFPVLGAMLWLACQPLPSRALLMGAMVSGLSALALATVRYEELRAFESALRDLQGLETYYTAGSTVVQANAKRVRFGSLARLAPLTEDAGRLPAARGGLELGNIDWEVPFGLVRFKESDNPSTFLFPSDSSVINAPLPLNIQNFECRTGVLVDYVVVFGRTVPAGAVERQLWGKSPVLAVLEWNRFESVLNERYALVRASALGYWELWGRRSSSSGAPATHCWDRLSHDSL
jgi:hypothetical protein